MALPGWLREILIVVVVLGVVVGALTAYTQNWPPAVIVESGSMMHAEGSVPFGRLGTIDPGDLVLVKKVSGIDDVVTMVEGGSTHGGLHGDVLIYYPANDHRLVPVIHRAVAYVVVRGSGNAATYHVRWDANAPCVGGAQKDPDDARWCVYGSAGIMIPDAGLPIQDDGYRPRSDGFITKGDNPSTNPLIDPLAGISRSSGQPIPANWIEGKARGELPWLGLIKLALAGKPNQDNPPASWTKIGSAYAPSDLWWCLGISLVLIVGGPFVFDVVKERRRRKRERQEA